jgi:TctA family transporter
MLDALAKAFEHLLSPGALLAFFGMIPLALLSGVMPGGNLPVTVVVLGFATHLDPIVAIVLVIARIAMSDITEPVPSILMGVPGARAAQATILDGYPMSRKGLAGIALGASYVTTLVGGIIGALVLLATIPVARKILLIFGSPEFFLVGLLGVASVAVVSSGAMIKGLLTAAFGFAIALIGFSPIGGVVRTTFGIGYLWDGVPLVPVVVGLFAIPEVVDLVVSGKPIARERLDKLMEEANRDVIRGMKEAFRHKWLMIRSSLIGVFVAMMPGLGAGPAHWISYASARHTEKGAHETFGTGDVRGVLAADAPNNSADGGILIPTLFFGIPGSGEMAIFLGLLILVGFQPGPSMVREHLDITLLIVMVIALSNIVVVPIMLVLGGTFAKLTLLRPNVLAPVVLGVVTLTAFQATYSLGDLVSMGVFGMLGGFMKRYGWPRPPILIALVLSRPVEKYLWLSINTYGFGMLARPQFSGILVIVVLLTVWAVRVQAKAKAISSQVAGIPEA